MSISPVGDVANLLSIKSTGSAQAVAMVNLLNFVLTPGKNLTNEECNSF
jgi:hypothetical protein